MVLPGDLALPKGAIRFPWCVLHPPFIFFRLKFILRDAKITVVGYLVLKPERRAGVYSRNYAL